MLCGMPIKSVSGDFFFPLFFFSRLILRIFSVTLRVISKSSKVECPDGNIIRSIFRQVILKNSSARERMFYQKIHSYKPYRRNSSSFAKSKQTSREELDVRVYIIERNSSSKNSFLKIANQNVHPHAFIESIYKIAAPYNYTHSEK